MAAIVVGGGAREAHERLKHQMGAGPWQVAYRIPWRPVVGLRTAFFSSFYLGATVYNPLHSVTKGAGRSMGMCKQVFIVGILQICRWILETQF